MTNRLRVLLIDDQPIYAKDTATNRVRLDREFVDYFELQWIQNAREGRWLLNAFEALSMRAPQELGEAGLPPELLIFDYALTQGGTDSRINDPTYPVKALQILLSRHGVKLDDADPDDMEDPRRTDAPLGKDRTGCYLGGELARVFSAYPCGSVPTTAHVDVTGTDAEFYEWLNNRYFMDRFKDKTRLKPELGALLSVGMQCLRVRLRELVEAGVVRISLETLQHLCVDPWVLRNGEIEVHSRFGLRRLPIAGLFFDKLRGAETRQNEFGATAVKWAKEIIDAVFTGHGRSEFLTAREIAANYWGAYISQAHDDRAELSELAAQPHRSSEQEEELERLCHIVGLDPVSVREEPDEVKVAKRGFVLPHWRHAAGDDVVARWVALFLAVRAEQDCRSATVEGMQFFGAVRDSDRDQGQVILLELEERLGAETAGIIETLKLRQVESGEIQVIELPITRPADVDDFLGVLDPLPESLFFYLHKTKLKDGRRGKMATFLTNPLKRLGKVDKGWGTLGLSPSDVLEGRHFDCEICSDAREKGQLPPGGEHVAPDGKTVYHHGIRRGEGALLRAYADELGFPESRWPTWLSNAP